MASIKLGANSTPLMRIGANPVTKMMFNGSELGGAVVVAPLIKDLAAARGIKFGMAINSFDLLDSNVMAHVNKQCDIIVPQTALKMKINQPTVSTWDHSFSDAIYAYAKATNKKVRGHMLIGAKNYNPTWANTGVDAISSSNWKTMMETRISTIANRTVTGTTYASLTSTVDVVNEAIYYNGANGFRTGADLNSGDLGCPWYAAALASDGDGLYYIDYAFQLARTYFPNSKLAYCNGIVEVGNWAPGTRPFVIQIIERLTKLGLCDVFASQWHLGVWDDGLRFDAAALKTFLKTIAGYGVEIQATEFDVYNYKTSGTEATFYTQAAAITEQSLTQLLELNCTSELVTFEARVHPAVANTYPPFNNNYTENAIATPIKTVLSSVIGSTKNISLVDTNTFFVRSPQLFNKALGFEVVRGIGVNDAGPAHEVYRKARTNIIDTLTSSPTAGGLQFLIASQGSQSYALQTVGDNFGGDYHGGETKLTEQWKYWDNATAAYVNFDPQTSQPVARAYKVNRTSLITWSVTGATANVTYELIFREDRGFETNVRVVGTATLHQNLAYLPMAMVQNTFTKLTYKNNLGVTVNVDLVAGEYDLPLYVRSMRIMDPTTRYYVDIEFTTDRLVRLYILNSVNFTKLYPVLNNAPSVIGTINVTQKVRYGQKFLYPTGNVFTNMIDEFDMPAAGGTFTPAGWTKTHPSNLQGSVTSLVSGGIWSVRSTNGDIHRWTKPIIDPNSGIQLVGDGTKQYRYTIDITTFGGNGGMLFYISSNGTGSTSSPIIGPIVVTQPTGGIVTGTFTPANGVTPYLLAMPSSIAGRGYDVRSISITPV